MSWVGTHQKDERTVCVREEDKDPIPSPNFLSGISLFTFHLLNLERGEREDRLECKFSVDREVLCVRVEEEKLSLPENFFPLNKYG